MKLKLDEKISREEVKRLATNAEDIISSDREQFDRIFMGKHSREFYEGALAAYLSFYQLSNNLHIETFRVFSGEIVAYVAEKLDKMYESD